MGDMVNVKDIKGKWCYSRQEAYEEVERLLDDKFAVVIFNCASALTIEDGSILVTTYPKRSLKQLSRLGSV